MKITVSKSELQSKLKLVGRIIQPQKTNPILEDFLFGIDYQRDDAISVTGSDESGMILAHIECKVEGDDLPGFTTPAKTLLEAVAEIPEQPLIFTVTKNTERIDISCKYAAGRFDIVGSVMELYTKYAEIPDDSVKTSIDAGDLLEGVRRTCPFCANDELRPVMNGIYFDQTEEGVTYVGTNGTVLTIAEFYPKGGERISFILPSKAAKMLTAILPSVDDVVDILVSSAAVRIQHPVFSLQYRQIDGRYPNYRSVIPDSNNKCATVDRLGLIAAVKRVSIFGNDSYPLVRLSFTGDNLTIYAQDIDYSTSANETLPIHYANDPIEIGFSSTKLIELLQNAITDEVEISLSDPSRAGLIREVKNSAGRDITMIIMPLTLQ